MATVHLRVTEVKERVFYRTLNYRSSTSTTTVQLMEEGRGGTGLAHNSIDVSRGREEGAGRGPPQSQIDDYASIVVVVVPDNECVIIIVIDHQQQHLARWFRKKATLSSLRTLSRRSVKRAQ